MRFISIVTYNRNGTHPHEDSETLERMRDLSQAMRADGTLVDTGGRDAEMTELRVSRKDGRSAVTDGPFAEAKEVVGGYAVLEVKDRAHAVAVTNRFLETLGADATCSLYEVFPAPELSRTE